MDGLNVWPWQFSTGAQAGWLGGPARDADGERLGGYVMMDLAMIRENKRSRRGWVITNLLDDAGVTGSCVKFYYAMNGVNVESLKLLRVDIDTSGDINKFFGDNKTEAEGEKAAVYSRSIEASFGIDNGEVEVIISAQRKKAFERKQALRSSCELLRPEGSQKLS